ncbi:MAG: DMT family transporter [Proteobacteria bacterium]|nr:DMT family transporter [Pseudomonadota bacterium]
MSDQAYPQPTSEGSASLAYLMLTTTVFMWALGVIIGRAVHDFIPPMGLSFWRWFGASMVLLPFIWGDLWRSYTTIKANIRALCLLAITMIGGGTLLLLALNFTTALNASLVNASQPAVTVLVAWVLLRENVRSAHIIGMLGALIGLAVMVTEGDLQVLRTLDFNAGDLLVISATFFYSVYAVKVSRFSSGLSPWVVLFVVSFIGSMLVLPLYIYEATTIRTMPFTPNVIGIVAVMSVLVSLIPVYFWNRSNRIIGANRAAIFVNLMPVFGAILAILFLGERLFTYHIVGAAFVAAGIYLVIGQRRSAKS